MALEKEIIKEDGTQVTYVRLISVRFPEVKKEVSDKSFQKRGQLTFHVFRDEAAAKNENRQPAKVWYIEVDAPFFQGMLDIFSMSKEELYTEIYTRAKKLPEFVDAVDLM